MKKQLIRFVVLFLICIWMPLGAIAGLSAVMFSTPWPLDPGDSTTFSIGVDEDGSDAPGKTVTFSVSPADGTVSLSTTSATTDSKGQASTTLRTGSGSSGSYTVTASVGTLSVSSSVTVNTPPPPPVLSISVISGPGSGDPGDSLTFTVEVQEDGSAASGKTVTFSITSGDGNASLGTTSTTTGSNGRASTSVTLGDSASGSYTITATVGSKSTSGTATVNTPPPPPVLSISVISGPGSGAPGDALTFTVEVQEDGSAASGKTVTFSITSGDGNASLGTASTTTGSNGRASTTLILGHSASGSYTITASSGSKSTSGTATVNTPPPPPVLSISVISGPGSGAPGDALTFTVEVQEDGSAASGKTVTFSITSGDGNASLGTASTTTGSNGRASTTLILGHSASGSYTIIASSGSKSTSGTATVNTPPPPAVLSISVVSGPGSGDPGDALTFTVEVQEDGSAASGKTVTFSITSGDGNASLNPTSATTGSNGRASTSVTLGGSASGSYTITATVGSKSTSGTATVNTPLPELSISVVSGPGSGDPGDALTFTVEVQEDGSAASGKTVTFSITSGDGNASLNPTSATTGSNGRASTSVTLGDSASGSYTITATVGSKTTSGTATVEGSPPPSLRTLVMSHSPWPLDPGESMTFTVTVKDDGSAASGRTVTFSVSPADGTVSLSTTSATTGSDGRASTTLRTGSGSSGSYTVTATVGTSSVSGTAVVEAPPPPPVLSISVISGPGSGAPGDALTFTVEVQEDGSAASGKTVTFSITSGDGNASLGTTSTTTGSNGRASTSVTLGDSASGSYTITATVGSKSTSGTATVNTPPPPPVLSISVISGPGSGAPGDALTFTVEVQEDGSAASGKTVTFSITSGDGNASLGATSTTTGSNGRASTTLILGHSASGSYTITASSGSKSTSGTATVNTPPPPAVLSISVVSGPGSGDPGDALTFTVEVQEDGSAASGKTVTFSITSGDGNASLGTTSATTGSNGRASTSVTLGGSASGSYTITATVGSKSTSGTATVNTPPPPSGLSAVMFSTPWPLDPGDSTTFSIDVQEDGSAASEKTVTFSVSPADGTVSLSPTSATTDSNGQASTTLRTGSGSSGSYTVTATVGTLSLRGSVTVETSPPPSSQQQQQQETPQEPVTTLPLPEATVLESISGGNQEGVPGEALANPFVVEARDQYDDPMAGVTVTFALLTGGGSLSSEMVMTDANGRAESTLTLGDEPGTNTVEANAEGLSQTAAFNVEAGLPPPVATSLSIVSVHNQNGLTGEALANPFVVEVRDQNDSPMEEIVVTFAVTAGEGSLSTTTAMTDANGQAQSTLTLGDEPGTNTVEASAEGLSRTEVFSAEASLPPPVPTTLSIGSGGNQEGTTGEALANPFVVEVRDQYDAPMAGVTVSFAVSEGGGALSATTAMTDANGRAGSTLTLGSEPGTNSVKVSVEGLSQTEVFSAEASLPPPVPTTLSIGSGGNQEGTTGEALANPFVVEVRDQYDAPMAGVTVSFAVSEGGGALSATTAMTDANGRAGSTLTLGSEPGTNSVKVSVEGLSQTEVFSAEASLPPPVTTVLSIVAGDNQEGVTGEVLASAFVVEVRDQYDAPLAGVTVTFAISEGGGSLSATAATTDANGRAESTLTLGSDPGTNSVKVSVEGISQMAVFSAEAGLPPPVATALSIVSGDNQEAVIGEVLANPFVVEVHDQYDDPMAGVTVTLAVSEGGGSLSSEMVMTDANGRAESILTLGPNLGRNTVTVSVTGIQAQQTVTAEGIRIPLAFWIISGDKQQGLPGEALANPFVVEVRDQSGDPLLGVQVTFSVTSGGGTLSVTSATTGSNGRTESILTLGPNPGTNTVEVGVRGIQETQSVSAIAELPPIPQDVNRDDVVNILDLVFVASALGDEGQGLVADVNGDGVVNILDLVLVAGAFGNAAAPSADPRALAMLTAADVGRWLAQAGELGLTDATSERGVLFLEQLFAALTPKETVLLPNYPNPFNPETWIPYGLANDTDVQISIYDISGGLVRQLDLGHQRAGHYTERSRAAYWDGRNGIGEDVASGVYFYTLISDDFTATRKMLIGK